MKFDRRVRQILENTRRNFLRMMGGMAGAALTGMGSGGNSDDPEVKVFLGAYKNGQAIPDPKVGLFAAWSNSIEASRLIVGRYPGGERLPNGKTLYRTIYSNWRGKVDNYTLQNSGTFHLKGKDGKLYHWSSYFNCIFEDDGDFVSIDELDRMYPGVKNALSRIIDLTGDDPYAADDEYENNDWEEDDKEYDYPPLNLSGRFAADSNPTITRTSISGFINNILSSIPKEAMRDFAQRIFQLSGNTNTDVLQLDDRTLNDELMNQMNQMQPEIVIQAVREFNPEERPSQLQSRPLT